MKKEKMLENHNFKIGDKVLYVEADEIWIVDEIEEEIINGIICKNDERDYKVAFEPKSLLLFDKENRIKYKKRRIRLLQKQIEKLQKELEESEQ